MKGNTRRWKCSVTPMIIRTLLLYCTTYLDGNSDSKGVVPSNMTECKCSQLISNTPTMRLINKMQHITLFYDVKVQLMKIGSTVC